MIKKVTLKNFQSHKFSEVTFDKGINVLSGTSDSGKSAILRAIRWVVFNKPSGDAMVSHWCVNAKGKQIEDTSVTIEFDNGTIVERSKGKDGNLYKVNGQVIEAFGVDVPQPVIDACNFSEVNLQVQHDRPFLVSESAGEVARFLNRIVKLDKIDAYLSSVEKKKRATKVEFDNAKNNLEKVERELSQFDWTDKAGKILTRLEKLDSKRVELEQSNKAMQNSLVVVSEYQNTLDKMNFLARAEEILHELQDLTGYYNVLQKQVADMSEALERMESLLKVQEQTEIVPEAEKLVNRISKLMERRKEAVIQYNDMVESLETYEEAMKVMVEFEKEYEKLKAELPKVCPTCGQEVCVETTCN
jgi:exonuclease SbcC